MITIREIKNGTPCGTNRTTSTRYGISIDRSGYIAACFRRLGVLPHWNLTSRPDLNGIEFYWACCKQIFRKLLLRELLKEKPMAYEDIVEESLVGVDNEKIKNCAKEGIKRLLDRTRVMKGLV